MKNFLATFFWDPPREAIVLPYSDIAIYWYSLFFGLGFLLAYFIIAKLLTSYAISKNNTLQPIEVIKTEAHSIVDTLTWYIFFGMLIGARLGHVLFYDFDYYWQNPSEIFMTRHGGLASHGATVGIFIGLFIFWKRNSKKVPFLSMRKLLDFLAIGSGLAGACIRVGNFWNQEILGTKTSLPWGVQFGHPQDLEATSACHPVQLYEAIFYLLVFLLLYCLETKKEKKLQDGRIFGLFLTLVFTFRFFVEWLKLPQEAYGTEHLLQMGQLLSVPFIVFGLYFLLKKQDTTC